MRRNIIYAAVILLFSCQSNKPLGLTPEEKEFIVNKTKESLVFVEGGTFKMGDVGFTNEQGYHQSFFGAKESFPIHEVTLDSYYMQKYEITYEEFDLFTKATGKDSIDSDFIGKKSRQTKLPATGMTWYEAQEYCEWVGEQIGVPMSLPTDAQWEYAARSRGQAVANATDNGKNEVNINIAGSKYPWYGTPPGTFPPNPLGLYDMTDGLAEWVYDYYYPFPDSAVVNPVCNDSLYSGRKIRRGYGGPSGNMYRRGTDKPTNTGAGIGLRCVANVCEDTIK